jgi:hypothetical protein
MGFREIGRMGILRRNVPSHYIPIHADNVAKKDWIVLLEAGTIVGSTPGKLRVALVTTEKRVARKYNALLRAEHFLVLDGYDPRIHVLYFCPQLYRYDSDNKLVLLEGEEIGSLLVQTLQDGIVEKKPWYEPSKKESNETIISKNCETVAVDLPAPTRMQAAE